MLNVVNRLSLVLGVAHENVEVIFRPKRALLSQQFIRKPSSVLFPRADNLRHRNSSHLEQDVDMVRHYHPRTQLITVAGKLTEVVLDEFRYLSTAQVTLAAPFVQVSLQFRPPLSVIFNLGKMLPLGTKRFRKTIGEMEGHELRQSRFVSMGQITAFVPTAKTLLGVFWIRPRGPASLALDQLAHAGIVRRPGTTRFGAADSRWIWGRISLLRASLTERGSATRSNCAPLERESVTRSSFANEEGLGLKRSALKNSEVLRLTEPRSANALQRLRTTSSFGWSRGLTLKQLFTMGSWPALHQETIRYAGRRCVPSK